MVEFKPLHEVFDGRLKLPGPDGKVYFIPEPDAELGLWCTALCTAGVAINAGQEPAAGLPPLQLDDTDELALYRRILGPVFDELEADGLGWATRRFYGQVVLLWIGLGEEAAEALWNSGGDPKAAMPRSQRRAAVKATGSTRSTAAASTTRPRASTSGTTPRKAR